MKNKYITEVTGLYARDLGLLCTSPNVNSDALYRPYEIGKPVFDNYLTGGDDGLHGYSVPVTTNNNVHDLWGQTWADKGRPTTWYVIKMYDGYRHSIKYDTYPFKVKLTQAGSAWVAEYQCYNDIFGLVNPGSMSALKDYYPAFQIFEQDTAATGPKTTPMFNWCSDKTASEGSWGEYLYADDIGLSDDKTYYIIPFLSQYKFAKSKGDMGTLTGNKYCLIYKDFTENDWMINPPTENIYKLSFGTLTLESSYSANVTFTLSARTKTWNAMLYGGYRVWTTSNNIESIWMEEWETYNYRLPSSGYYTITTEQSVEDTFSFSFQGSSLPSNATRIEIIFKDPTHNNFTWMKSFDI